MTGERFQKLFPVFLTVIIILVYYQSLHFGFLHYWDNEGFSYIEGNKLIQTPTGENLKTIFTTSFDNHYHPLTILSLAIDYSIGGENPLVFRITNLLLFIFSSVFLFIFIKKLTRNIYAAAFSAVFFAVHPFNVESVLWLSERKNLLFVFFLFPAFIYYIKHIDTGRYKFIIISSVFFLLSLLSKSQGLPFAILVFVIDYFRGRKMSIKLIYEKIPILITTLIFIYLTIHFHKPENFVRSHPDSLSDYFFAGFRNIFFYFSRTIFSFDLSAYYPYPSSGPLAGIFWYYPIIILSIVLIIYRYFRKEKMLITGLLFMIISLFPLLKFIPVPYGNYIAADRYMLLPLSGSGLVLFAIYIKQKGIFTKVLQYSSIVLLVVLSVITFTYIKVWKDDISFYSALVERHPDLRSALGNRGKAYMARGEYNKAIEDFSELIHLSPDYPNAYLNRGLAYIRAQKPAKAFYDFSTAIQYDPANFRAYNNRALLLLNIGKLQEAKNDIMRSIEIQPDFTEAWANKSLIEAKMGFSDLSLKSLDKAVSFGFNNNDFINYIKDLNNK